MLPPMAAAYAKAILARVAPKETVRRVELTLKNSAYYPSSHLAHADDNIH